MLLDDLTAGDHDLQVQSIAHGALLLEHSVPDFGGMRRRLRVIKYRGSDFRSGYHDYTIRRGGLEVYPRLVAAEHRHESERGRMKRLEGMDRLLGAALELGTAPYQLTGEREIDHRRVFSRGLPNAARRRSVHFRRSTTRCSSDGRPGIPLKSNDAGLITGQQVDPAGALAGRVRHSPGERSRRKSSSIVVLDSLMATSTRCGREF